MITMKEQKVQSWAKCLHIETEEKLGNIYMIQLDENLIVEAKYNMVCLIDGG